MAAMRQDLILIDWSVVHKPVTRSLALQNEHLPMCHIRQLLPCSPQSCSRQSYRLWGKACAGLPSAPWILLLRGLTIGKAHRRNVNNSLV